MSITTIIGPMFSGKTSELIRLINRNIISGKKCIVIKHNNDNRFNNAASDIFHITTHSGLRYEICDIIYLSDFNNANELIINFEKYDVIGIEEGFFFSGIKNFSNLLANNNKEVIISTLDGSYKQKMFNEIGDLLANSEFIIKLTAVCMNCKKNDAIFTIRTTNKEIESDFLVGSEDIYKSVCRKCLLIFRNG